MKTSFLSLTIVCCLAALWGGVGCSSTPPGLVQVRFLQASPDAPSMTIQFEGSDVLQNFSYQSDSGYLQQGAGTPEIKVLNSANSDVLLILDPTLVDGQEYTIILADFLPNLEALFLTDNNTPPASGNYKLRFIHVAPSAPDVDLYVTAPGANLNTLQPDVADVEFTGGTDYLQFSGGNYQITLTPTGTKTVLKSVGTITIPAGSIRTAVLLDAPGGGPPFTIKVMADVN